MKNKEVVGQVIGAFLRADVETALSYMTEDVKMGWPGYFDLPPGKAAIGEFFKTVPEMVSSTVGELLEEGDKVVATGSIASKDADGKTKNSFFCDLYQLENGKVKCITSYMVFEVPRQVQ